jgi:predicted KAP-like P-loop ATPase
VCGIVKNEHLLPATIGVYGDWGGGKSNLIQMATAELEKDDDIVVLSFNGWLFEGYEDAKTALMGTILEELLSHRNFLRKATDGAKKLGKRLLHRVNLLKVLSAAGKIALAAKTAGIAPLLLGLSASSDIVETGKQLSEKVKSLELPSPNELLEEKTSEDSDEKHSVRKTVREFRKDFSQLLKQANLKTLVVVIDDLDRCLPDTIIETLEAIKLFLFAERTAFIIGTDEELVRYAVRKHFPEFPGDRREVGTAYLEKLIQFPVRVPPLGRSEVETYISLLFASLTGLNDPDLQKARECVTNAPPDGLLTPQFNLVVAQKMFPHLNPELAERLALAQRITPILSLAPVPTAILGSANDS